MYINTYRRRRSIVEKVTEELNQLQLSSSSTPDVISLEKGKSPEDNKEKEELCASCREEEDEFEDVSDDDNELADKDGVESGERKQSRSERKSRMALMKLGFEPLSGVVHHVTVKKKGRTYAISSPDVYKHPTSETYVIFGQAVIFHEKVSKLQNQEQQETPESSVQSDEEEVIDDTGMDLNPMDIELVMKQTHLSWEMAVKLLKNANNDIVTAIMAAMNGEF